MTPQEKDEFPKRMCPDIEPIKHMLKMKNIYSDLDDRRSFSLEIIRCKEDPNDPSFKCKTKDEMNLLFPELYFTFYYIEENIAFGDSTNIGKRPITSSDKFHSQFQIELGKSRDNNNYLSY